MRLILKEGTKHKLPRIRIHFLDFFKRLISLASKANIGFFLLYKASSKSIALNLVTPPTCRSALQEWDRILCGLCADAFKWTRF